MNYLQPQQPIVDNPTQVTSADLVVGIPSLNEVDSIAHVVSVVDEGLKTYFPELRAVIINVDNFSTDGTRDAFLATETDHPKVYVSTPEGVRGKGNNVRNLLLSVTELGARAALMVDADLKTITPAWIRYLAEPVLNSHDLVTPLYVRHKYDGTITNHIAYPLVRSVFGMRLRQPIGGDFGFSGDLASALLGERTWTEHTAHFGIDVWMTVSALARRYRVCQAFLGAPKGHRPKDPTANLGPMFVQVVSTLFSLMQEFDHFWRNVRGSQPSSVFGFGLGASSNVDPIDLNTDALLGAAHKGRDHRPMWEDLLSDEVLEAIDRCLEASRPEELQLPTRDWARILFDFSVAWRDAGNQRDELVETLVPLYNARVLAYANRTLELSLRDTEEYLENVTRTFTAEKPWLIRRWRETSRHRSIFF